MSHFHDCPQCGFEYQCDSDWPQQYCPELDEDERLCVDCKNTDEKEGI